MRKYLYPISFVLITIICLTSLSGCIVITDNSEKGTPGSISLDTETSKSDTEPTSTPVVIPDFDKTVLIDTDKVLQVVAESVDAEYPDPSELAFILNRELVSSYADTDQKKALILSMYTAMLTSQESVSIPDGIISDAAELKLIMNLLDADAPEILHINEEYKYYTSDDVIVRVSFTYSKSPEEYHKMLKALINKIDSTLPVNESDYDTELAAHDAILSLCTYDSTGEYRSNAYGAYVDGKAICEGYSDAFTLSMFMRGIKCCQVWGTAKNNEYITESHAWNIVKIDKSWYSMDLTWDEFTEPAVQSLYSYFNLTDNEMNRNHIISDDMMYIKLPKCTTKKYNYHIYNDMYLERGEDAREALFDTLDRLVDSGRSSSVFLVKYESKSAFDDISDNIESLMKTWLNEHANGKSVSYSYTYDRNMYVVLFNVQISLA